MDIFIKILQNGSPVAQTIWPLGKKKVFSISSSQNSDLSIPLYPLSKDLPFLDMKKKHGILLLSEPWTGFLTSQKKPISIDIFQHMEGREFPIYPGDMASLNLHDLQILIKIEKKKKQRIQKNLNYHPKLLSLFIKNKQEKFSFVLSIFISAFFISCICIGLFFRTNKRPEIFEDLADSYTLPFINKDHITTSPEALKFHLDRKNYIRSVVEFYRKMISLYSGNNFEEEDYFIKMTNTRYKNLHSIYNSNILDKSNLQKKSFFSISESLPKLSVPTILGESFQKKTIRTLYKIDQFHLSLKNQLEDKKKTAQLFRKDPEYDWTKYGEITKSSFSQDLSKIKVFKDLNNETMMYEEARLLGEKAENLQKKIKDEDLLKINNLLVISVDSKSDFALFLENPPSVFNDSYFESIIASTFSKNIKDPIMKIREPLIGSIDLKNLKKVIKENKYKLNLCYERALRRNLSLEGPMDWSWRIDTHGDVSQVSLDSTLIKDYSFISCIKTNIMEWPFPKSVHGSVKISHTFVFQKKNKMIE
jgi:hypothetical protein